MSDDKVIEAAKRFNRRLWATLDVDARALEKRAERLFKITDLSPMPEHPEPAALFICQKNPDKNLTGAG